jgi:hypothetical protein
MEATRSISGASIGSNAPATNAAVVNLCGKECGSAGLPVSRQSADAGYHRYNVGARTFVGPAPIT